MKKKIALYLSLFYTYFLAASSVFGQIDHWETVVYEYDLWKILAPTTSVPSDWNTLAFDDAAWTSAVGGFGYGDGDDNTVLPGGTVSCYQRIEFLISDTNTIDVGALTLDYDDAFVAYLNGVEITRDLLTGSPAYDQFASGLHEADIYQGNYPFQYTISKAFLSANLNQGNNVLAIQTHNESVTSSDMTSRAYLSFGMNISSITYTAAPSWFVPPVIFDASNLPIVVINTYGSSILDEPKILAEMGIIYNGEGAVNLMTDPFNEYFGYIGIETRGSSSGSFPKKAYGLETRGPDSSNYNVSIFDWPADNDWILYAPYSDKSLIRNVLTYKIGNEMGQWAPRTKLCELVINGEYRGVYVFMERIKQNPGRVNIDPLTPDEISGSPLTGGYIVKIDKTTAGGIVAWTSPYTCAAPGTGPITFQLHDPEIGELNLAQLNYIQSYITDFEDALAGPSFDDPTLGYRPFIDVASFVDFMIVNEISKNVDGYRISTYMYKERDSEGGKLVAGPLWDFNLGWGNANYCQGGWTTGWEIDFNSVCGGSGGLQNPFYWLRLVQDPDFTHRLNCRWQELRQTTLHTDTLLAYIDETALYLEDAADRNFVKWPVLGTYLWPNNFVGATYAEEIDYLKTWIVDRMNWLDANMYGSCADLGREEIASVKISVQPNPFTGITSIAFEKEIQNGELYITNSIGEIVLHQGIHQSTITIDLTKLPKGIYFLNILEDEKVIAIEKLISI